MTTLTPAQKKVQNVLVEMEKSNRDFIHFLKYVKVESPPQVGNISGSSGAIPLQLWPHTLELAESCYKPWRKREDKETIKDEDRKIVIGKSRQIGFSWVVGGAYACWLLFFKRNSRIIMTSQGEDEANDLLSKTKFVYDHLPEEWKMIQTPAGRNDSSSEMVLFDMESSARALPSTARAGRGGTYTVAIVDEADFHSYLSENMNAIMPAIDAGGQIVMGSTVDKHKASSRFQDIVRRADQLKWSMHFFPYDVMPSRDEEWYEQTRLSIPEEDLKGMTRDLFMEQEYPRSLEEMLSPPKATSFFDYDMLMYMQRDVSDPYRIDGIKRIWKMFNGSRKYAAASDIGSGRGGDYSITSIVDVTDAHCEEVAMIMTNEHDIDSFIFNSVELLKQYGSPMWVIENNGIGEEAAKKAYDTYNHTRLFHERTGTTKGGKSNKKLLPGLRVTPSNRLRIWTEFMESVNRGEFTTHSMEGIRQMFDVIHPPGGRPEARSGAHDDYPAALAVLWYMKAREPIFGSIDTPVVRPMVVS